jgi:hypothetical protein
MSHWYLAICIILSVCLLEELRELSVKILGVPTPTPSYSTPQEVTGLSAHSSNSSRREDKPGSLFFLDSTGVWTQVLTLARQALYHLNHSDGRVFLRYSLANYCLGWVQTSIYLISASWVARIIDVRPSAQSRDPLNCPHFSLSAS